MNKNALCLTGSLLLCGGLLLSGCKDQNPKAAQLPPHPVGVVTLRPQPLAVKTELPGRTNAYRTAEVRPQVSGIVLKRQFVEGSDVQAGQSLYQIDPATYQAACNSALGDLKKAQASSEIAHLTVQREQPLRAKNYVSPQEFDTSVAQARQADADVFAARAALETARINLQYTKVISPISGRIGKSSITEGALVTSSQSSALATVQQLDPMYVDVTQSSDDFLKLKQAIASGAITHNGGKVPVSLILNNGQRYQPTGTLEFSDVTVDQSTGSITLRAIIPNPQHSLLPGMYVRAEIDQGQQKNALLVPQQGITRNPRGEATALIADAHNKAQLRQVTANQAIGDKWLVTSGLQAGDRVIVSGLMRLKPGMTVRATEETPDSAQALSDVYHG
ncbi:efflux RND transporter periplasmic adaptor subunit [Pseudomonas lundensis]|uniref:efflux RND transporter periplasmic adaptor subunit n=1 Tax=Serratia proteamaculans TaxID=28151 RepID=UPI002981C4A2|nr:efflux RND transporter periplasmic adaptor subunit [Serratia proteamaculans]MDW5502139.1 efflux RND transporter periplasmic adaptor subunit [Serratia proteamaculans]MDW5507198.1 efflux RND transporter periplasmic adaptor subunit [Pseudomonas lundensis]